MVSRKATLKYMDRKLATDAIAAELGATLLVDGRVERAGDRLGITLSLLEPGAKVVALAERVRRNFAEVFSLQREVAAAVAGVLRLQFDPPTAAHDRPTRNVEAFADYAQARSFLERPDVKDDLDRSIALFQGAIQKDPRFARAHAGLGEAYWRKYQATRDEKWSVQARDAINEALAPRPQRHLRAAVAGRPSIAEWDASRRQPRSWRRSSPSSPPVGRGPPSARPPPHDEQGDS